MPQLPVGLADIKTDFPTIEPGEYRARIEKPEMGESRSKSPMLTLKYKIQDGEYKGQVVFQRITFLKRDKTPNEAALRELKRVVEALLGEDRANDPAFDTDELNGLDCTIVVEQRSWVQDEGTPNEKRGVAAEIQRVLPV